MRPTVAFWSLNRGFSVISITRFTPAINMEIQITPVTWAGAEDPFGLQYNQFTVPRIPVMLVLLAIATSCAGAADRRVSFSKDIQPIFETSCWNCHGATLQLSQLDLRTRESALKGAEHGIVLVPGKAEGSRLYRLVAGLEKPRMPMNGKLTPDQIEAIKLWIDQGAQWEAIAERSPLPKRATGGRLRGRCARPFL